MEGHGNSRGFSLPPSFEELSRGREDGCRSPSQGENFLNQQFTPVFNSLSFTATPYLEHGSLSKKRAGPGGAGKEGKETEGRDTSLSSLRPLLPRHRRSPNWRGTGFSTAFASTTPSPRS